MNFRNLLLIPTALALLVSSSVGCAKPVSRATIGSLTGAALGAGAGAIIGNQSGNAGAGTAIGAGIGALGGALAGNALDGVDNENQALDSQIRANQARLDENRRLIEELRKRGADVRATDRGVVVNLPDILFEFDRARLTPEAVRTVSEITGVIATIKNRNISIEGHTDSIGSVTYNKQLSERRAQTVSTQLAKKGVSRAQMTVTGFGEGAPISTNNTEAGRARNRRVEIIIEN